MTPSQENRTSGSNRSQDNHTQGNSRNRNRRRNANRRSFGNDYDRGATVAFFRRWWKVLLVVFVVAAAVSVAASFCVTPRYKSSVILFPTNSNRLSKAITANRYSLDYMDYGIERDCEYTIQILLSQSMEDAVCKRFNLMEHYGISPDDPHKLFKLHEAYRSYVSVKRTEYLGVEVGVLDVDPQYASDIANFIAANYDTLCHQIHRDRAVDAFRIMDGVCAELESEIDSISAKGGNGELVSMKRQELAAMQTLRAERKVDLGENASYKFWLDQASPSDKKAYPKRAVIVLLGSLGTLLMCILVLLVADRCRKQEGRR